MERPRHMIFADGGGEMALDRFDLNRFVEAQAQVYEAALSEIRQGAKRSHWMWFIFPQVAGLGSSPSARHYAIASLEEARAYLDHPVLGERYRQCIEALQDLPPISAKAVFGTIDAMKLRSSLTLFAEASKSALFDAAIDRWCGGEKDVETLRLLDPISRTDR
jgi:uncharacterized protein (DUF1810 family)